MKRIPLRRLVAVVAFLIACDSGGHRNSPVAPAAPAGPDDNHAVAQAINPFPVVSPVPVPGGPGGAPVPGGNPSPVPVKGGPNPAPVPGGPGGTTPGGGGGGGGGGTPSPTPTPSGSPTPHPTVTTIISVASGRNYRVVHDGMVSGAQVYIDRPEFHIDGVFGPETGFELVQTAFADGTVSGNTFLQLGLAEKAGVIVVMPGSDPEPIWFNLCPINAPPIGCWKHTGRGWTLHNTNDANFFDVPTHRLQVFNPGTITLGGRGGTTTTAPQMYFVAVFPCRLEPSGCT
jgi:hypothetical protein